LHSWPAKAASTGFSRQLHARLPNFSSKAPACPYVAAPTLPAASYFMTIPAPAAADGVPWPFAAIATKLPPSCAVAQHGDTIPEAPSGLLLKLMQLRHRCLFRRVLFFPVEPRTPQSYA
jgi:hypothetical protein